MLMRVARKGPLGCRVGWFSDRLKSFVWKHEIRRELRENDEMSEYFEENPHQTPLQPTDAFSGERCQFFQMLYDLGAEEQLEYLDFSSLYPYVCARPNTPLDKEVLAAPGLAERFEKGKLSSFQGLIKCRVLPFKDLLYPIIGFRHLDRLLFPLCKKAGWTLQEFRREAKVQWLVSSSLA